MREYFSALVGNESAKTRLGNAISSNRLPHALLFIGPSGSGKKTLALEIEAALNCENKDSTTTALPCHACNTCRRIFGGSYTDISFLSRKDKSTIGVDEIRLFREDMFLSSTESSYKIYVINEADRMTVNAQNALLTVLEEPPRNVIIILLAESGDNILTTIKSRAQTIAMQRFDHELLKEYALKNSDTARSLKSELLDGLIMASDGRIGEIMRLLSEKDKDGVKKDRESIEEILLAAKPSSPYSQLLLAISALPKERSEFIRHLELLICAVRDALLIKLDPKAPLTFYTDRGSAEELAREMSTKRLLSLYDAVYEALEDTTKNVGVSTVTADLGVKIKQI